MSEKSIEIGTSVGLVFLMIALMVIVQMTLPENLQPMGFVAVVLAFMISMGAAGLKLIDVS